MHAKFDSSNWRSSAITVAVAAAVATFSNFSAGAVQAEMVQAEQYSVSAADTEQASLTDPVKAGNWLAARNVQSDGDYDINVFDRLITEEGSFELAVNKTFAQSDFDAVKAVKGFEEFGNYYEDDEPGLYQVGMVNGVLINGAQANVHFENASVVVTGGSLEGNPYVELGGIYQRGGVAEYTGESTSVKVSTTAEVDADGESYVYGYSLENPLGYAESQRRVTFAANKTEISAESTSANGLDAIALDVSTDATDNPTVDFARGDSTLSATTAAADKYAIALFMHNSDGNNGSGSVTLEEGATLNLVATGGVARGLHVDHGSFTSNGTLDIRAESDAENTTVYGIFAADDASLTFNGETRVFAQGNEAYALFVGVNDFADEDESAQMQHPSVVFGENSVTTLNGAVLVEAGNTVTLDGTMTVNGDFDLAGDLRGSGSLTLNGQKEEFGSVMEGAFVREDAALELDSITLANVDFTNYGDVGAEDKVVLGDGAKFTNLGGVHANRLVLQTGGTYYEEDKAFINGLFFVGANAGVVEYQGGHVLPVTESLFKGYNLDEAGEDNELVETQLLFAAGDYDWETLRINMSERTEGARLEVRGGSLTLDTFDAVKGDASVTGGELHVGTLNASGKFTMAGGEEGSLTVGTFQGAAGGDFTLASGVMAVDNLDLANGRLTIAEGANLSSFSGEIFSTGLGEDGTAASAGSVLYGEDHLFFADGSTLTLRDAKYNIDYANSADDLLGNVEIVFKGELVDNSGEAQDEIDYGDVEDGKILAGTDIVASADENGTVTVGKSVGGKTFVVKNGTSVAVNGEEKLTVVGSDEGGELIDFGDAENTMVTVNGGLALGVVGEESEATKGTISSDVTLADGSTLTSTNGEFTLKNVAAEGADITVGSGSLKIESFSVTNDNQLKGTLDADLVTGDGTIRVGSADEETGGAGTLNVETLEHTGIIFVDPAWVDDAEIKDGSFLTVQQLGEGGVLNADVVVGQNSTFVFGATKDAAVKAFAETGLKYGEDADVTAVLYVAKAITVGEEGSIIVDGTLSDMNDFERKAGNVTIAANGLAMIDAAALADAKVAAVTASTVDIQKDAQVRIANLTGGLDNAVLFEATDANGLTVADDIEFESNDSMINVSLKQDGNKLVYSTEANAASDVFAGFEGSDILQAIYDAGLNNTHSSDRTVAFLSNMAAFEDHGMSKADAIEIGNDAMALAAVGGVYNVALDASGLMNRSIDRRMSVAGTLNAEEGVTFWADVFATRNEAESLYGSSGYSADLYGGVFGADVALGNGKRIGAAVTVGTGDAESEGSALKVDNDADFVGVSLYGSHRLGDFNGKVDFGYMHTKSDLSATALSVKVGDEVAADAWTVGIGAEYLFNMGSFDIVPHVGIRWTRLDVDGYTGAFKTEDDTMDVFTAPIGVAFAGSFNAGGWKLAPTLDLSIVPNFGDDEATSTVRWNNIKDEVKTQVVDDAPFRASLGLNAQTGDWTIGAAYDLGVGGDDRLDNMFTVKARYQW